jgi:PAS domain S-box-containing protein
MKKYYGKSSYWIITIAIFLVITFAFISFQLSGRIRNIEGQVSGHQEKILQLHNVQGALLYNESNARSYVITPTPQLEVLLKEVPDLVRDEIKKLRSLIADEPYDKRGIDSLLFFANKRLEYTGNILKIRKEAGFTAALDFINSSAENFYISKTRSLINQWKEQETLEQQNDLETRKRALNNFNLLLLSIFLFMIILGVVYVLQLHKNIIQRTKEIENAKFLETVLNTISEPVITTDANFNILAWNKAAEKLYGLDASLSKETDIAVAVHSQFTGEEKQLIRNEMRKNGFWKGEVRQLNAEGQEYLSRP